MVMARIRIKIETVADFLNTRVIRYKIIKIEIKW